jgi:peptidoglycan/LPS O-acetylase OafA/YrhL
MASAPNVRIDTLQAGRALAALAVVGFHSALYVTNETGPLPQFVDVALRHGDLGVDFFFVLSGFIIYLTNRDQSSQPGWLAYFAQSRLTRIFLPYWPVAILLGLAYTLFPNVSEADRPWDWFTTITLLPTRQQSALAAAWTLQHELIFYALALTFLGIGRPILGCLVGAAAIVIAFFMGSGTLLAFPLIDLEFLFGIVAAWWILTVRAEFKWLFLTSGIAITVIYMIGHDNDRRILFGLGMTLIIIAAVQWERGGRLAVPRLLVTLGNASYAIYLIHLPLLSLLVRIIEDPLLALAACLVASVAAGCAYHVLVERPLLAFARRRFRKPEAGLEPA